MARQHEFSFVSIFLNLVEQQELYMALNLTDVKVSNFVDED
jgi:hypothetical protein